ncbi:ankyrin repeat-containing domain protein [Neocallimastix sp. 'constans']
MLLTDNDKTVIFIACELGNKTLVKYLVKHGADVNRKISTQGVDINKGKTYGETPLFFAFEYAPNINKESNNGETPLIIACKSGCDNMIKSLIEHGADLNKENINGETPLLSISESGKFIIQLLNQLRSNIYQKLNNRYINPNSKHNYINETILRSLVDHGTNENKELKNPKAPLFIIYESRNETNKKYLDEHEYKYNGITSLLIACESGNKTIIKYLVEHDAKVNKELRNSETPLYIGCRSRNGNNTIVKYLVDHGADIKTKRLSGFYETYLPKLLNES